MDNLFKNVSEIQILAVWFVWFFFFLEAGQVDGGFVNLPPGKFTITLRAWESLATVYKIQLYWCVFTVRVLQ